MPYLQCTAHRCASNANGCCCQPSISVADAPGGAGCRSFSPKSAGAVNQAQASVANHMLSIGCTARSCRHNEGGLCQAPAVNIAGSARSGSCQTFESGR